jgi:GntR family transcriptional regulator, transcriptional repressor for pyruvate dehydrogenase complex
MQRVQPVHLTESALTSLSEYLSRSAFQVGDRLPAERIIAEQLGVSRPILREALKRWAALGIIETRNGSGSYLRRLVEPGATYVVLSISAQRHRLEQLLELRRALEVEAAGLAAARRSEADLAHLHGCFTRADQVQGLGGSDPEADWAFHRAIYQAAGNPYFQEIVTALQSQFHLIFDNPLGIRDFAKRSWPLHRELLEAIEAQDVRAARECASRILDITQADLSGRV